MKQADLMRWGGFLGMAGAVLLIIGAIIHPIQLAPEVIASQKYVWAHVILGKGLILTLLGLVTIYLSMSEKAGKLGLVGFLITFAALCGLLFIVLTAATVESPLAKVDPKLIAVDGPIFSGLLGLYFFGTIVCYIVGFLLFGISVQKTNKIKWPGTALIIGALPMAYYFINMNASELMFLIGIVLVSVGLFALNRQIWTD